MAHKRVAIVQSSYIPWKGYFDVIHMVDEFILYDDAQFTRRDWRNRNRIKTPQGPAWLSIPVKVKGKFLQAIKDTVVVDRGWRQAHWKTLRSSYARAPHFARYARRFEELYLGSTEERLSAINREFLGAICDELGIRTALRWSMDFEPTGNRTERLVSLCLQAGAGEYVSGPSAQTYLDPTAFERAGIRVSWVDYAGYPEYEQLYPPFEHTVSILDLLFSVGPDAPRYMKSFPAA